MTRCDRGSATVLSLALVHLLLLLGMVGAVTGSLAVTRARAAMVADLAALAGAQSMGEPCIHAQSVAEANGVAVSACTVDGADVIVEVEAETPEVVGRWFAMIGREPTPVRASARAGMP